MAKLKALQCLIIIPFVECCIIILLTSMKIHLQDKQQMIILGRPEWGASAEVYAVSGVGLNLAHVAQDTKVVL